MTVKAIGFEFPRDRDAKDRTKAVAEGVNRILETGEYIGHIIVPVDIGSFYDNRTVREVSGGIVILVDQEPSPADQ